MPANLPIVQKAIRDRVGLSWEVALFNERCCVLVLAGFPLELSECGWGDFCDESKDEIIQAVNSCSMLQAIAPREMQAVAA